MSFIHGETVRGLGQCSASQAVEYASQEMLGESGCQRASEEATQKQAMIDQEFGDSLIRVPGLLFQGKVSQLTLSQRMGLGVCQVSSTGVSRKCGLTQVQPGDVGRAARVASVPWVPIYRSTLSSSSTIQALLLPGFVRTPPPPLKIPSPLPSFLCFSFILFF